MGSQLTMAGMVDPAWVEDALTRLDPRYRPVWEHRTPAEQAALALYFLHHRSKQAVLAPTRPRLIKWYAPFACQKAFASGHRYCINSYVGCHFRCCYCYVDRYAVQDGASPKEGFVKLLDADLADLEEFDVPAAPVHLSNSTDPLQPLEQREGHTRHALEGILAHRHRFTTVTLLTKNPALAARPEYTQLLAALSKLPAGHPAAARSTGPAAQVEVSLAFFRDDARRFYEPNAPSVAERIEGISKLAEAQIPLCLRVDPLFVRSPLGAGPNKRCMEDFGLPEAQTLEYLEELVALAQRTGARRVVFSVARIASPSQGRPLSDPMQRLLRAYRAVAGPQPLDSHGGSWRLPPAVAQAEVVEPFLEICSRYGVTARHCRQNLISTS